MVEICVIWFFGMIVVFSWLNVCGKLFMVLMMFFFIVLVDCNLWVSVCVLIFEIFGIFLCFKNLFKVICWC